MKKVLFIMPPTYHAHLPHFRSRFELLSENVESHVLFMGDTALDGDSFKGAVLHVQPSLEKYSVWNKVVSTISMILRGVSVAKKYDIDCVLAYDPLKLGVVASVVKLVTGCTMIIEVNGHLKNAHAARAGGTNVKWFVRKMHNAVCWLSLYFADVVKLLNKEQFEDWLPVLKDKPCFMFHDYVPTHLFSMSEAEDNYILCVGFPLKLKGVDVLLDAYDTLRDDFPGVRLVIMGHCREPELSMWKSRVLSSPGAELKKPVFYDEMQEILHGCILLALPSRSEAMGRVLIEAMACGKAIVGSRVGGIPNVIQDGMTGLLVEPGNVEDLARKLRLLLEDKDLRRRMGKAGYERARTVLSGENYARSFCVMLAGLDNRDSRCAEKGVIDLYGSSRDN